MVHTKCDSPGVVKSTITNMAECKAAPFPFHSRIILEEGKSTPPMDCTIYRQLIGSLLYLTHSQTDICYAMSCVKIHAEAS